MDQPSRKTGSLVEHDQTFLEIVASCTRDADTFWNLLASESGPSRLLSSLGSRGFARAMREGQPHAVAESVEFTNWKRLRPAIPVLQLMLEVQPEAVSAFAGRKKRRARSALVRYVESIQTQDLGAVRDTAEYVGALLGSRISLARRFRESKMERTFQYLGSVVSQLGQQGYVERSVVALREIEASLALAEARLRARTDTVVGGPRIDFRDVAVGPLTSAMVASVRSVVWDRSIKDPSGSGRALGIDLMGEWENQLPHWRTIQVLRFALQHLAEHYAPGVMDASSLLKIRTALGRWREAIELRHGIPEELITAALGHGTQATLLYLPGETTSKRIEDYLLHIHKDLGEMRSIRDTYRAVEGRRDMLRRQSDGALIRILHKPRIRGLFVFCASHVPDQ